MSLVIKVEDDGPGIPENEYENVFKPFYKLIKEEQIQIKRGFRTINSF